MHANRDLFTTLFAQHGLESFLDTTHSIFILLTDDGKLVSWNHSFDAMKAGSQDAILLRDFLVPESRPLFDQILASATHERLQTQGQLILGQGHRSGEYACSLFPARDGYILFTAEPIQVKSGDGETEVELQRLKQLLLRKDVELQGVIAQADEVSHTDALTFLPNRRQIMIDLQKAVEASERYGAPLSISMLDIDHFKNINDTYGHPAGDEVLRNLADQLRQHIRQPDTIGRFGGEEFLIVLPHSTLKAASDQAGRLCGQIRSLPIKVGEHEISVTVSIGVAQYKLRAEDWQSLLKRADDALYKAKNQGRDRWAAIEE